MDSEGPATERVFSRHAKKGGIIMTGEYDGRR